ncbi:MAG: hypothetical protein H8D97_00170, partial [Proteobacteria bacterium]|nr:hypothetical protein [Pseudomonadota bacterium]
MEGLVSKIIKFCEQEILRDSNNINNILNNLVAISDVIGNNEYSEKIKELNINIHTDPQIKREFIKSVKEDGFFFEAPCFANFNIKKLLNISQKLFGITTNDAIRIKQETFEWIKNEIPDLKVPIPDNDVIYNDIYNSPIYIIKLMQLAENKINVRDFGEYSASKQQPKKDKNNLNKASKLGNMEFDAFLAHNCINTIRELRSV